MTTWLIHGFNVTDSAEASTDRLIPYVSKPRPYDYGFVGLIRLRCVNRKVVKDLVNKIKPGDSIVAHSNGCLIAWQVAMKTKLASIVCINPALRRDTLWPKGLPVLCLANSTDWVVQLGRAWSRLVSLGSITPHGWGAAGRYGFSSNQPNVSNWDTAESYWPCPVKGHSGVFKYPYQWGTLIDKWITETAKQA